MFDTSYSQIFDPRIDPDLLIGRLEKKSQRKKLFNITEELVTISKRAQIGEVISWEKLFKAINAIDHLHIILKTTLGSFFIRIAYGDERANYFYSEQLVYELLEKNGVQENPIIFTEFRSNEKAYDFQVMKCLEGTDLETSYKEEQSNEILSQLAHSFKTLHSLGGNGFGFLDIAEAKLGHLFGTLPSWHDHLFANYRAHLDYCSKLNLFPEDIIKKLQKLPSKSEKFCKVVTPQLLHGDILDANIMWNGTKLTMIDMSFVRLGDPLFDLAHYALYYDQERINRLLKFYGVNIQDNLQIWDTYTLRLLVWKVVLRHMINSQAALEKAILHVTDLSMKTDAI